RRDEPLWWTLRRPFRRLSYDAARAMFDRANAALGANWTLHDLRHSAAYRMASDPEVPLTDVQWVLGHARLSTTQLYLTPPGDHRHNPGRRPGCPGPRWSTSSAPRRCSRVSTTEPGAVASPVWVASSTGWPQCLATPGRSAGAPRAQRTKTEPAGDVSL